MSSSKVQRSHREMYKARTPPWKETYRKRCLERLRESRDKLKARFRKLADTEKGDNFIEDLMKEELKTLRAEHCQYSESSEDLSSVDVDKVLDLFDDIQEELRKEELKMLEEFERYEQSVHQEEQYLCSAINKLCTEEVICPLCKKNPLMTNKTVIFCRCGMRIDTEDCLTLTNVQQQLTTGLEQHSQGCECEPSFSMMTEVGTSNLLMTCSDCLTLTNVQQQLTTGLEQHSQGCECEPSFSMMTEVGTSNLLMTCSECDWMSVVI